MTTPPNLVASAALAKAQAVEKRLSNLISGASADSWHDPGMVTGWANNSSIAGDENWQYTLLSLGPNGAVAFKGTFSRSGTTWSNTSNNQVATVAAGYYSASAVKYITITGFGSTATETGTNGGIPGWLCGLKIDQSGNVWVYTEATGFGVNGNVFFAGGMYLL